MNPDQPLSEWTGAIAAAGAAPGGGAAAAVSAALSAAVAEMVAGMTLARKRYAAMHGQAAEWRARAAARRQELLALAVRDSDAFRGFERALALPAGSEPERRSRREAMRAALTEGARVQFAVLERTTDVADLAAGLAADGLATAVGDSATAGFLAAAAARSAYWAVRSNLQETGTEPEAQRWLSEGLRLLERAEAAEWRIRQLLNERVR